ncbi:MAG: terpene cyclase/mutase family protein [Planctomycetaceae bacterium]|nr:terpene cyclase/mutase family protein [Planctomycetaceae bacterium]
MRHARILAALALLLPLAASGPAQDSPKQERAAQERRDDEPRRSALDEGVIVVTPEHSRAVERGLEWLASQQVKEGSERGSWIAQIGYKLITGYKFTSADKGHVGVTAMAGMAFLAGGHLPGRGKYGRNVEDALEFVLKAVQTDGYVTHSGSRMYSHAFATLFLAEVYGQTHRQDIRGKLQLAVDFIVHSQNSDGGWRYEPYAQESDMSIVVCQVMALRAARNIGIRVPKSTIDMAAKYVVDSAVTEESLTRSFGGFGGRNEVGSFHYQKNDGSRSSFPLTAAGVTALYGAGVYSDQSIDDGIRYLRSRLAQFNFETGRNAGGHYFFWYGHYYGVQAMYTAGSDDWESYFATVRDEILRMQNSDGSWPNAVGPGPALGTAAAVLILEIPYRYLPIFQR